MAAVAFDKAFERVDVLISPTSPVTPWKLGEKVDDPLAMYLTDLCTLPTNLAGTCAISVPAPRASDDGLPVGLQIVGREGAEVGVLRIAQAYEAATRHVDRRPELG